jgi:hypothetical protein
LLALSWHRAQAIVARKYRYRARRPQSHRNQGLPTPGIGSSHTIVTRVSLIHRFGASRRILASQRATRAPSRFCSDFNAQLSKRPSGATFTLRKDTPM